MSEKLDSATGLIAFHFDVPQHHIPLSQFIESAESAQEIIDCFNQEFFDNKLKYELRVVTPQQGGLIELLDLVMTYGAIPIWAFLGTDIGKAYIKGLTGHEPAHWAELLGKKTKELSKDISEIDKKKLCTAIIALMVIGFLQKDTAELQKTGLSKEKFRDAYSARNKVYQACIENPEVRGLGFDTSHVFPIKRADFPGFIVDIPAQPELLEVEESKSWKVDTVDLIVHSPNWKRDSNRKWQGSTSEKQDISFVIEDENFWHHVKVKGIDPDINDNMRVQWAYPERGSKISNARVLRVLSYNGMDISEQLDNKALMSALGEFSVESREPDLFAYNSEGQK